MYFSWLVFASIPTSICSGLKEDKNGQNINHLASLLLPFLYTTNRHLIRANSRLISNHHPNNKRVDDLETPLTDSGDWPLKFCSISGLFDTITSTSVSKDCPGRCVHVLAALLCEKVNFSASMAPTTQLVILCFSCRCWIMFLALNRPWDVVWNVLHRHHGQQKPRVHPRRPPPPRRNLRRQQKQRKSK